MGQLMLYSPPSPPAIDERETARYLGYGVHTPDDATLASIRQCSEQLRAVIRPRVVYTAFPLRFTAEGVELMGSGLTLPGEDIALHLSHCHTAVLMAATLSAQGDALIRRAQAADVGQGLVMDCCATTAVEQLCDDWEAAVKLQYPGASFAARFSPGYGDLPITLQQRLLTLLDAPRRIGLCATDSHILTPRKSVTALLSVGDAPAADSRTGCDHCRLQGQCAFRQRGEFCGLVTSKK